MIDPLIGKKVLGRYRILRSLAVGGMGVIYLGRSEGAAGFAKPVVIKRVVSDFQASDDHALDFFVREATILAELRHPGIVSVVDFGEDDGAYTMVLEYVHGYHLGQWLKHFQRTGADFPADLAIHIVCQLLDALEHAHHVVRPDGIEVQVIHRDVTPSNVLVDLDGHVKLADFGIARISKIGDDQTQSGVVRGKMPYLAPELLHGKGASASSDVYSVAVMLHELLLGRNDFRSEVPAETVRLVLHGFASAVEPMREDAPRGIDAVLERALAKERDARYATAEEFRAALKALTLPPSDVLARRLAEQVKHDYAEMPGTLGLERLEERDAAWRYAVSDSTPPPPMRSSYPTMAEAELAGDATTRAVEVPTRAVEVPTRAYGRLRPQQLADGSTETDEMEAIDAPMPPRRSSVTPSPADPSPAPAAAAPKRRVALVSVALLSVVAIGIGIAAIVVTQQHRAKSSTRFIVIENDQDDSVDAVPSVASDRASSTPNAASSVPPETADAGRASRSAQVAQPRTAEAPTQNGTLEQITQAFASRRGAIRGCFERHTTGTDGPPAIEIRFRISAAGQVEQANLSPSSMESTELGACISRVARGTQFGAVGRPMGFTIPVTASRAPRTGSPGQQPR